MEEDYISSSEIGRDSTVELYPLQESDSDDDASISLSNEVLSNRAWGKKKKVFYNADLSSDEGSSDVNLEEEEMTSVQHQLYSAMSEGDFESHWLNTFKADCVPTGSVPVTLNTALKFKSEDDALPKLIKSFQRSFTWILEYGIPLCSKEQLQLTDEGSLYLQSKVHLLLCYCVNILYYMQLSVNSNDTSVHPVIEEMVLLRQFISRLKKFEELEAILHSRNVNLDACSATQNFENDPLHYYEQVRRVYNITSLDNKVPVPIEEQDEINGKRAITYQISRNKGIAPSRKKEQRNPRVKHRRKYQKALIKRRSQVLPVVHETNKYDGESTGIRTKLTRSVILK